jgi:integrase/recombinase XerD
MAMARKLKKRDLRSLLKAFEEDCMARNMTLESIRRYISCARIYGNFCKENGLVILKIKDKGLLKFLTYLREERKNSQKTIMNVFNSLSTFYEFLIYNKIVKQNPIHPVRKRFVRTYKKDPMRETKQLLSVEEMAHLISIVFNPRDRAVLMLLAKTGIRRNELITLDLDDIDIIEGKITLKPTAKRSNRIVFFDGECSIVLRKWLDIRYKIDTETRALFLNSVQNRIHRTDVYDTVTKWAQRAGYHNPKTKRQDKHFGPHCFRHWFTTHLMRNGMPRDYVKELRGDVRREAIDLYNHIDYKELKKAYLSSMPLLFSSNENHKYSF